MIPLTGYADRWSVKPGESIAFKISSSHAEPYHASLVKIICGDPNPAGPGIREQALDAPFSGAYPSREQTTAPGSYAMIADHQAFHGLASFTVAALIWPSTPDKGPQSVISKIDPASGQGFALAIGPEGVCVQLGEHRLSLQKPLRERCWYRIRASYDDASATLTVAQEALQPAFQYDDSGERSITLDALPSLDNSQPLLIAAINSDGHRAQQHFNGKIEQPLLIDHAVANIDAIDANSDGLIALWDFSQNISGLTVHDSGPHTLSGKLINLPTRAMTGSRWDGSEHCWRHAPQHYGAIHFHDDDIDDCGWATDFSFTVPDDFPSGVYGVKLRCGEAEELIPFFIRPLTARPQAKVCVLIPTFTYTVYTNYARGVTTDAYRERARDWGARPWTTDEHSEYGLSTYNYHTDGSGICYSSFLRPNLTMRSGFLAYVDPHGSGLRHFPADTHLIDWLEARGHDYDVITDHDLHAEGLALLAPYKTVLTTTHPEYHTTQTLDALQAYTAQGGRLVYLGGNGFYWKVALNPDLPGVVEIRRAEGGIRAWAAEPGEYYNSFDGEYGGMWRRNGRPPQQLAGVGFTSQGLFEGSYYRRLPVSYDSRFDWLFEGIDDERIGDFGFSGGGAAGFELDRVDTRLGTPLNATVLARSEAHDPDHFVVVHEEWLTDRLTWPGEPAQSLIRADMTYFDTPRGGAVFSVGSITFCGSLAYNAYDNNISTLLENVLRQFTR